MNTDAPLTQIEELTAALKKCGPREKLLDHLKIDFLSTPSAKDKIARITKLITAI